MEIEEKILQFAQRSNKFRTSDTVGGLGKRYSRQYLSSVLSRLVEKKKLVRGGSGSHVYYALPAKAKYLAKRIIKRLRNIDIQEHEVMETIKAETGFFGSLPDNVESIIYYAFTEMLNNAIEHSQSKTIYVEVWKEERKISFIVRDYGIGVFKNVMQDRNLSSELEAIQDLLKGKITTKPRVHSGEGIFFTSKAVELFILDSFEYRLRIDNIIDDLFIEEIRSLKGTRVYCEVAIDSERHLSYVFTTYQTDPVNFAFDKTEVHVRLYQIGTIYISRSQARRVLAGLDRFKTIVLDFAQVPTIGQAFADEIFRVFKQRHPEIKVVPIQMNETVKFMVKRARNTQV